MPSQPAIQPDTGEASNQVLVRTENVSMVIGSRTILKDITIQVKKGEVVSIVGPNGGGKTTLLKIIIGTRKPTSGKVWRSGKITIGYQPQRTSIDPSMPMSVRSLLQLNDRKTTNSQIEATIEELGLDSKLLDAQATTLSGGERQLMMVARSMLCEPDLLVLDEPGTYCDPRRLSEIYAVIERYAEKSGCATLLVSHDISRVLAHSDRIHCIDRRLLCEGGPEQVTRDAEFEEIFGEPAHTGIYRHRHRH